ncbi:hypothetical protein F01_460152 [Burkholderia cenocepacia]|nr:hypothetical protein F01_460152 [Burkholderia cenocepacia]
MAHIDRGRPAAVPRRRIHAARRGRRGRSRRLNADRTAPPVAVRLAIRLIALRRTSRRLTRFAVALSQQIRRSAPSKSLPFGGQRHGAAHPTHIFRLPRTAPLHAGPIPAYRSIAQSRDGRAGNIAARPTTT